MLSLILNRWLLFIRTQTRHDHHQLMEHKDSSDLSFLFLSSSWASSSPDASTHHQRNCWFCLNFTASEQHLYLHLYKKKYRPLSLSHSTSSNRENHKKPLFHHNFYGSLSFLISCLLLMMIPPPFLSLFFRNFLASFLIGFPFHFLQHSLRSLSLSQQTLDHVLLLFCAKRKLLIIWTEMMMIKRNHCPIHL